MKTSARAFVTMLALAMLLMSGDAAEGAEMRWNGDLDASWNDPAQWQILVSGIWQATTVIPGDSDQADLPGAGSSTISLTGSPSVGTVVVSGTVTFSGNGVLTVTTSLTDNQLGGTITATDDTALILGPAADSSIYCIAMPITNQGSLVTVLCVQSATAPCINQGTISGGYTDTDILAPAGGVGGIYGLTLTAMVSSGTIVAAPLDITHNTLTAITFATGATLTIPAGAGCSASGCSYTDTTVGGAGTLTCIGATFHGSSTLAAPVVVQTLLDLTGPGTAILVGNGTGSISTGSNSTVITGTGTISGSVSTKSPVDITPGGVGTIGTIAITGNLSMPNGSSIHLDLDTTDATDADHLTVGGSLSLGTTSITFAYDLLGSAPLTVGTIVPFITAPTHTQGFTQIVRDDAGTTDGNPLALAWNSGVLSVQILASDLPPIISVQSITLPADAAAHTITIGVADGLGIANRAIGIAVSRSPAQSTAGVIDAFLHTLQITPKPGASGTDAVTLTASDGYDSAAQVFPITYSAPPAPVFTGASAVTGNVGKNLSYQIAARNGPTAYTATPLPPGLTLNPATGLITGVPTDIGVYAMTVTATNATATATTTITITVLVAVPVITSALTASVMASTDFTYQITASGSPTAFDATPLPTGLTVDAGTGIISGQATTAGSYHLVISASNPGGTGTASLALTVNAAAITTTSTTGGTAGSTSGTTTTIIPLVGGGGGHSSGGCGLGAGGMLGLMLFHLCRRRRSAA